MCMSSGDKTEAPSGQSCCETNLCPLVPADSLPDSPRCLLVFSSPASVAQVGSSSPRILAAASVGLHLTLKKKQRKRHVLVVQWELQTPHAYTSRLSALINSYSFFFFLWLHACPGPGTCVGTLGENELPSCKELGVWWREQRRVQTRYTVVASCTPPAGGLA